MQFLSQLQRTLALVLVVALTVGPSDARTRKGDKFFKKGQEAEERKQYEEALEYYDRALSEDAKDPGYQLANRRIRFQAGQMHVSNGQKLRDQGQFDQALVEFQKAFVIDPASQIAVQEIQRTTAMIVEREKSPNAQVLSPAEKAKKEVEGRIATLLPPPALQPINRQISSIKMNNQPVRVLYETVGKLAGINVLFDPQFSAEGGQNLNIDLQNANLEEALNYIALLTHTFWKPITKNAIFVTNDNPTKRTEYQDQVVKIFYFQNATTTQEFTELYNAVRIAGNFTKGISQIPSQNALVVRGSPDMVDLAEKIIHDIDKAKGEVVIDVIVMEANKNRTRTLAAALNGGGLSVPINFTPTHSTTPPGSDDGTGGTTTPPSTMPLSRLGKLSTNDFSVNLPGALLQALMADNSSRVLQRPQIRATDGGRASLKIGDRIPFVTGSLQSAVATPGSVPFATTQFQYADIGVNIDLEPKVNGADEVTMKIKVDVSTRNGSVNIGGIDQPIFGQRTSEAVIRLKEGEVSILGGLTTNSDTRNLSGLPGFVDVPVLGLLGGSNFRDRQQNELLIALIPHIVRSQDVSSMSQPGISSGSDQVVKLLRTSPPMPPLPNVPAPTAPAPSTQPAQPAQPTPPQGVALTMSPNTTTIKRGETVTVAVQLSNSQDLFAAPLKFKYDGRVVRLVSISPGTLMGSVPKELIAPTDIRNDAGEGSINLSRLPGAKGVDGGGDLCTLKFEAIGAGNTKVTVIDAGLKNSQLQPINTPLPEASITVQ